MRENDKPDYNEKPLRVVVIDADMKFSSMVIFMLKWALAAIPAMLMLIGVLIVAGSMLGILSRLVAALP
jgi:hypothetical protein